MKIVKSFRDCIIVVFIISAAIFSASPEFIGNVSYTLKTASSPTADQSSAYTKIKAAMDSAIWYYNTFTIISKKLTVEYNTSVQTADGNSNGNIRFGSNRSYMTVCTSMHEIAHTVGIGTVSQWATLISNGKYTGTNGINALRQVTEDSKAILNGDNQHFWPYGLNYESEVKSKNDFIYHCKIVNAIQKDLYPGKFPSMALANTFGVLRDKITVSPMPGNTFRFTLPVRCFISFGIYTPSGQKTLNISQGNFGPGTHSIRFNDNDLSQGLYVYRFQAGDHIESHSFIMRR